MTGRMQAKDGTIDAVWPEEEEQAGREVEAETDAQAIWRQAAHEPDKWFARFEVFRTLGAQRSLAEAYRLVAQAEGLRGQGPNRHWTRMARRFAWRARASAWDVAERARLRRLEAERRFDAREARLGMIDHLLEAVFRVLVAAEMDKLGRDEARQWVPMLRIFFKDLLAAQRVEWQTGLGEETRSAAADTVTLHADDLLRAQAALERWQTARVSLLQGEESKS